MDAVNDAANPSAEPVPGPRSADPAGDADHPEATAERTDRPVGGNRLYPRVTSFRMRRGAVSPSRQDSWDRLWPVIGKDVSDEKLDADAWFGRSAPLIIEIGCGTGTATAAMAQAEPQFNLIGIEVYKPGLAQLVQRVEREGIENLRVLRGDAVDVLENMIAPESLTGVRVFFPDPWPKARHHKRRLLQPETFALIASRLIPGGVLHVATDHADYAEWIGQYGNAEPQLIGMNEPTGGDPEAYRTNAPIGFERPITKFENKGLRAGSAITEFIWGKIES
ncbi:tRNA (guanosine(46)-N7)-methyltransferase TrmB [Nocardia tengchongensis]|uniref:tRNA (guanine-N(7)-)-methyltransferase n=2 Tax=Nocardia tengchongensis TaxID=2055889 RepID=A0ABX8CR79_9NOCA|nr:tRNA (guanosine(46)-N7)-methyltransferase TrmB [Nocardia tengchongensis]QVI22414.1 tRNA (guanosine(46)-N7)-methyltransferase TrmB [Nocardia tengchongensis]